MGSDHDPVLRQRQSLDRGEMLPAVDQPRDIPRPCLVGAVTNERPGCPGRSFVGVVDRYFEADFLIGCTVGRCAGVLLVWSSRGWITW